MVKFLRSRPQIENIRSKLANFFLKDMIKLGVFDFRFVFLDFTNKDDLKNVSFSRSIEIKGQVMWMEK